jgi:saccharopine dehydrogenase-like NADP-dependent oxidoreductase
MSIIILGGCGEIGRYIAKDLVKSGLNVTIADIREVEGKLIANRLGHRASFLKLNIMQFDTLVEALKDYELVINIIGPYFMFGDWIPRAAIQAGINYLDICDDHDMTLTLLNLNKRVEREGLTFLINSGASPGLTNIMAKMGAEELDQVRSVRILWYEDTGEDIGFGALMHWAHIAMGKVPIYRNGKWMNVRALTEREIVKFPDPCGLIPIYYCGHPEPVTIPRYIDTDEAICKGGVLPEENILLTKLLDRLIIVKHVKLMKLICKFFLRMLPILMGKAEEREVLSAFRSDVIGKSRNKNLRISRAVVGSVTNLTSMPASIAAQMILEKNNTTPGLFPPEGCPDLNANRMIAELEKRGIYIEENRTYFP